MGRARKRARLAAQGQSAPAARATSAAPADRPLSDPAWRRAERRRVLLLGVLPGPPQRLAARGAAGLAAAVVVQTVVVLVVGLLVARAVSGQWLPSYAGLVVLAVAVASQYLSRAVNSRTSSR